MNAKEKGHLELQWSEIEEAFSLFDSDNTGVIDFREMKCALRALGLQTSSAETERIFATFGKKTHESINVREFGDLVNGVWKTEDPRAHCKRMFDAFDKSGRGKIGVLELKAVCEEVGETISESELMQMIDQADRDNDGFVDSEDFYRILFDPPSP